MSLALARKYRPSTFDDLIGQEAVSQTLSLALDGDRLSHAYLFSGLRGSGKTSTARIFAKALLCENGATSHPCNHCIHCTMANESRHMDIIEMDAASNRGIDDIKDLIEHTKYKPSSARYKIFIIDEVHMLTNQAFNALLKTLEEPPDFVKFILATTDPLKLPATILSRTQHFRFKKIPQNLVLKHLEHILALENIGYEAEALDIIARTGAGSLRDSLTLMDQAIVYSKNYVNVETVTGMLGIIEPSLLENLLKNILRKDTQEILNFIKLSSDYEAEMILDELTLYLKELLLLGNGSLNPMSIERFFRVIAESKSLLSIGSDSEFVLSLALFKMVESLEIKDIDTMIKGLENELKGVEINEVMVTTDIPDLSIPKKVITITQEEIEATLPKEITKEVVVEEINIKETTAEEITVEPIIEEPVVNKVEKVTVDLYQNIFDDLVKKIYDRNYELGRSFENNIKFLSFADNKLTWESSADGDEKKQLITHWGIINMFVKELFGFETKIVNIPKKKAEVKEEPPHQDADSGSMIEALEMKSSCIAPEAGETEAAKEKDPSTLLQEPMVKEAIELFNPKKVRIKRNA
ncbi:MAG: DNA polymerase III subunit gamma/tau [Campylobacterota bacterium]|nr:DNA polymerase III subunit gamma/tau [Campylobacterota bacterium]